MFVEAAGSSGGGGWRSCVLFLEKGLDWTGWL